MKTPVAKIFLTAEWRHLAMFNYEIPAAVLEPMVPRGTELDFWNGKAFVSLVGFLFLKTHVWGMPFPGHRNFEEVNLRFYVRRKAADGWRRGVVFIKELVPRRAIAFGARKFYNENYLAVPMAHEIGEAAGGGMSVAYCWWFKGLGCHMKLTAAGGARPLVAGSKQEFITEHYWGYSRQQDGSTMEYRVEHEPWRVWESEGADLRCDVAKLYGEKFISALAGPPASAFLADGSKVKVFRGVKLGADG